MIYVKSINQSNSYKRKVEWDRQSLWGTGQEMQSLSLAREKVVEINSVLNTTGLHLEQ